METAINPNTLYWILFIGIALLSWIVSASLESKFNAYSKVPIALTGRQVAEKMLRDHGLTDVQVTCVSGRLTDHYNPTDKTVNLSESVYNSASVAAAAVAAHECGHAVQHATAYAPLQMRSALVPAVDFASRWVMWVLLAGMLLINVVSRVDDWVFVFALTNIVFVHHIAVEIMQPTSGGLLQEAGFTDRRYSAGNQRITVGSIHVCGSGLSSLHVSLLIMIAFERE